MADNASRLRNTLTNAQRLREGTPNPVVEFSQQFAGSLLDTLEAFGGPSYAVEETEEGYVPARPGAFREGLNIPEPSDSLASRMGQVGGEAATLAIPLGGAASQIPRAAQNAGRARAAIQNFLSNIGVAFRSAPLTASAIEGALGATAGAGGYLAEELYPDSESARFVGEIIGGWAPSALGAGARGTTRIARGLAERLPASGWAINKYRQARSLLNPVATRRRATERMRRATPSPEGAAEAMGDELLEGLTPAARTGDRGLMALEASVDAALNDADKFLDDSIETVNENLKRAIDDFGTASPEATNETYLRAQNELRDWLDGRLQIAAQRTEDALTNMSPNASRETVNRVASQQLREALESARVEERALYDLIPQDAIVPTNTSREAFRKLLSETSQAEIEDLPSVAQTFLGEGNKAFGEQTTIKEIRGLQSKLRQISRNSRTGDNANLNRARIADILADAITEDISNTQGGDAVSGLVQSAVGYSRDLNQRFRQGTVGVLLGLVKQGEARVPAGLVLEQSIGLSGPKAREAFDDILRATGSPEVKNAMEDFIRNRFFDYAVENGEINRSRAANFIRSNKEVLGRLPEVGADLARVSESLDLQDLRLAQRGRVSFDKPSVSRATMFIERGPQKAFNEVLNARNPGREMANLVNMARRDTTGEALEGLKNAFSNYVQKNVMSGDFIAGNKLGDFLSSPKNKQAMNRLFSKAEMNRWRIIERTAERLDLQRKARPSSEGVLGDEPGKITTVLARLLGARSGTAIADRTGIGGIQAQAIMSERFKDLLEQGLDPARELIMRAIQDEGLFKEVLLAEVAPDGEVSEQVARRLNAWLLTLGEDEE